MTRWSTERIDDLKRDWAAGYTATEIKERIPGTTRNSILGKINRLGLHNRRQGVRGNEIRPRITKASARKPRKQRFKERKPTQLERAEQLACTEATNLPPDQSPCAVSFVDLAPHHCRWPIEPTTGPMMYCGADKMDGGPYCGRHHRITYHLPERRRAA